MAYRGPARERGVHGTVAVAGHLESLLDQLLIGREAVFPADREDDPDRREGVGPVGFLVALHVDVEAVFFYPWAVLLRQLKWFGLIEMLVFMGILLVALAYVWRNGGFDWE